MVLIKQVKSYMKLSIFTIKILSAFVGLFTLVGIYGVILATYSISDSLTITSVVIVSSIVIIGLYYVLLNVKVPKFFKKHYKNIMLILISVMFVVQVVVGVALYSRNHSWDVSVVEMLAQNYVDTGTTEVSKDMWEYRYLNRYDNNIPITLLITGILKVGQLTGINGHLLIYVINGLLLFFSSVIVLYIVHKRFGRRYCLVAYIILLFLVTISPYAAIFYTDTTGMFFVSLIMLCIFKVGQFKGSRKKYVWLTFLGGCSAVGLLTKPTTFIVIIALVMSLLIIKVAGLKNVKRGFFSVLFTMAGFIFTMASYEAILASLPNFAKYSNEEINEQRVSFAHYLGMGSLRGLPPYEGCTSGGYCSDYADWINSENGPKTAETKKDYSINIWKESLLTDFPSGYTSFIFNKIKLTFSDGSFGAWVEGGGRNDQIQFRTNDRFSIIIRSYLGPLGTNFKRTKLVWQVIWLSTLILIFGMSTFILFDKNKIKSRKDIIYILTLLLTFIGLVLYQMLFESRARYIFLYIPLFVCMAIYGLERINNKINKAKYSWGDKFVVKLK